ncbi:hypothetical protein HK096_004885, partial [Nowakowskiella sp. JEL0078]
CLQKERNRRQEVSNVLRKNLKVIAEEGVEELLAEDTEDGIITERQKLEQQATEQRNEIEKEIKLKYQAKLIEITKNKENELKEIEKKLIAETRDKENLKRELSTTCVENNLLKSKVESFSLQLHEARTQLTTFHKQYDLSKSDTRSTIDSDRYLQNLERSVRLFEDITGLQIMKLEDGIRFVQDEDIDINDDLQESSAINVPAIIYTCRQKAGSTNYKLETASEEVDFFGYSPILRGPNSVNSSNRIEDTDQFPVNFRHLAKGPGCNLVPPVESCIEIDRKVQNRILIRFNMIQTGVNSSQFPVTNVTKAHHRSITTPASEFLQSKRVGTVKQGFAYKRGTRGILATWRLKFLVLDVSNENNNNNIQSAAAMAAESANMTSDINSQVHTGTTAVLKVFDQRGQVIPKHEIPLKDAVIRDAFQSGERGGVAGMAPFIIETRNRKYFFAAQTKSDHDEWVSCLTGFTRQAQIPQASNIPIIRRGSLFQTRNHKKHHENHHELPHSMSFGSLSHYGTVPKSQCQPTNTHVSHSRRNSEWDQYSTYSDDSVVSGAAGNALGNMLLHQEAASIISSAIETLSFCSEPVLTPQELSEMGKDSNNISSSLAVGLSRSDISNRRGRKLLAKPMDRFLSQNETPDWNEKYQKLLSLTVDGPESALRQDIMILELVGEFKETAQIHVTKIVDEFHLKRKIRENDMNSESSQVSSDRTKNPEGENDGQKIDSSILMNGIVFNFATNYDGELQKFF